MKRIWLLFGCVLLTAHILLPVKEAAVAAKPNQIKLPKPSIKGTISLEEAISKRRSQRSFSSRDLSLEQLGQLLWAAQGITAGKFGMNFRAAPSAGALYPLEIYLVSKDGLFHYMPESHSLDIISTKDLRQSLSDAALGQDAVREASVDIVICAVYSRATVKYGQRGVRYTHIEAGHAAQNVHLQAVSLGLSSVPIGAFNDEEVKKSLFLMASHEPIYIIPVGYAD